jgi:uncharacterized protein DUF4158
MYMQNTPHRRRRVCFEDQFGARSTNARMIELSLPLIRVRVLARWRAAQLKVPTGIWAFYAERDQTRREHLAELQERFGYQTFTRAHYRQFG